MVKPFSIAFLLVVAFHIQAKEPISTLCGNNEKAKQIASLIMNHSNQKRPQLICNKKLNEIALIKVNLLKSEKDISHTAGHTTPNHLLRKNGYDLSKRYPTLGNQVEAIAGGEKNSQVAFQDFLDSESHRILLLAEHPYFLEQNDIGVAYIYDKNTPFEHYWVVLFGDQDKDSTKVDLHKEFKLSPIKK